MRARLSFIDELKTRAAKIYESFSNRPGEVLDLTLKSALLRDGGAIDCETILSALRTNRGRDIALRSSQLGPHRDDIKISLADVEARSFASQGQTRSIVLALKLAVISLLEDKLGDSPVILLDDVDSELDQSRCKALLDLVLSRERQVIITSTSDQILAGSAKIASQITISEGRIFHPGFAPQTPP